MSLRRKIVCILTVFSLCFAFSGACRAPEPLLPTAQEQDGRLLYGLEQNGRTVLDAVHEDLRSIGSVYALALEGRWALFARDGSWRTDYAYEDALPCEGGVLCIESAEHNRAVIFSYEGQSLLDTRKMPVYEGLAPYAVYGLAARSEGFSAVYTEDGACAFLDAEGNALPVSFQYTEGFHEGAACVLTDGRWGYLAPDGSWLLAPQYLQAQSFHGGCALVRDSFGQAVIDREGNILWRPEGDYVWQLRYGAQSFFGIHADGKDRFHTPDGTLMQRGGVPLLPEEYLTAELPGGIRALLPDGSELFLPGAEELLWGDASGTRFAVKTAAGFAVMDEEGRVILRTGSPASLLADAVTEETFIFVPTGEYFSVYTADGHPLAHGAYLTAPVDGWFALSGGWRQLSA